MRKNLNDHTLVMTPEVVAMYTSGRPMDEIVKHCSVSRTTIRRVLKRNGIKLRTGTFRIKETKLPLVEMVRLYESGKSVVEVARLSGLSETACRRRLMSNGTQWRNCLKETNLSTEEMIQMYESGKPLSEISTTACVSRALVRSRLKTAGIKLRNDYDYKREDLTGRKFCGLTAVKRVNTNGRSIWLCRCDCGKTTLVDSNKLKTGNTTSCGCRKYRRGKDHPRWNGGGTSKYHFLQNVVILGKKYNSILEHRAVMMGVLGRELERHEHVHHKNGITTDNRPENLELWTSSHPPGQRREDVVAWAVDVLKKYSPSLLASTTQDTATDQQQGVASKVD